MVEVEKLKEIVQDYLRRLEALEKERDQKLCAISCDDPLTELEVHDEYVELENKLWDEYAKRLEGLLDEVDLEFVDDRNIKLGKKLTNTRIIVYYYNLPEKRIDIQEFPLISKEKTPFTCKLISRIDWFRIRPIWSLNIQDFIIALAEAEHKGELEKAIKEVERRLRAGAWIYEYENMLHALEETIEEMKKQ